MTNYCTDADAIKEAHSKGIIGSADFQKWNAVQGYRTMLNKSIENSSISKATYANEVEKTESFFFERDLSANTLRFILKGVDGLQPLDLFKQNEIWKSIRQEPLQRQMPVRVNESMSKINAIIAETTQMANEMKRRSGVSRH